MQFWHFHITYSGHTFLMRFLSMHSTRTIYFMQALSAAHIAVITFKFFFWCQKRGEKTLTTAHFGVAFIVIPAKQYHVTFEEVASQYRPVHCAATDSTDNIQDLVLVHCQDSRINREHTTLIYFKAVSSIGKGLNLIFYIFNEISILSTFSTSTIRLCEIQVLS